MTRVAALVLVVAAGTRQEKALADPVTSQLEEIRAQAKLPALGGAIVTGAGLQGSWVTGVRANGHPEAVTVDDQWHLGSCTKAMTATLIALLVERGDLDWETTLAEALPDLAATMDSDYKDVTLTELLTHRAGVPANPTRDDLWTRLCERKGSETEQRRLLTETVLRWGPVHRPGTKYLYSNAGFAIAGHVAECVTKKPWEELMQELLFKPLGMESAGYGPPGTAAAIDQPRGHDSAGLPIEPDRPAADNPPAIGPGGTVHASLADWGKFIALHLKGAKEDVKVGAITLHRETFAKLHTPFTGPQAEGPESYAMGWSVATRPWAGGDGLVWNHNGSNTMWFCVTWLAPNADFAVLVTTNMFGTTGPTACDQAATILIAHQLGQLRSTFK